MATGNVSAEKKEVVQQRLQIDANLIERSKNGNRDYKTLLQNALILMENAGFTADQVIGLTQILQPELFSDQKRSR